MRQFGLVHVTSYKRLHRLMKVNVASVLKNNASLPPRIQGVGPVFFGPLTLYTGGLRGPGLIKPCTLDFFECIAYWADRFLKPYGSF
jgi:hypothetical protein